MTELEEVFANPIAHRGLHDRSKGVIENSRSAFARAAKAGYAIECDLQLSGDGEAMVFHDYELDRLTKQTGPFSRLSAGQLTRIRLTASRKGDTPMRFAELLELIGGKVPLVVELKHQKDGRNSELARTVVATTKNYTGPFVFKSFNPRLLELTRSAGHAGALGIIVDLVLASKEHYASLSPVQRFGLRHLLHYPKSKFDFISANHKALKQPAVRLLRRLGFPVMTWTIGSYEVERTTRGFADQIVFENYLPFVAKNKNLPTPNRTASR
ncbi:MAG TPA: glycerophosphodiester phosphodiesterase [Devosia sp.]|nr:glycerophosphodiester phosphodiesterase [Devosia sp.]